MSAGSRQQFFLPPLLRDEFLVGYRARLSVQNNCPTQPKLYRRLQQEFPVPGGARGLSRFVANLAVAHGTSEVELLRLHTVWPLFAAFPSSAGDGYQEAFTPSWLKLARPHLMLCPTCLVRDEESIEFSYWRRSHQIPGVFACPEHGHPLRKVLPPSFLRLIPGDAAAQAAPVSDSAFRFSLEHPIGRRTQFLLTALCSAGETELRSAVYDGLRKKILAYTALPTLRDALPMMAKIIAESVCLDWLSDLLIKADISRHGFLKNLQHAKMDVSPATIACLTAVVIPDDRDALSFLLHG